MRKEKPEFSVEKNWPKDVLAVVRENLVALNRICIGDQIAVSGNLSFAMNSKDGGLWRFDLSIADTARVALGGEILLGTIEITGEIARYSTGVRLSREKRWGFIAVCDAATGEFGKIILTSCIVEEATPVENI